jgi:hypothetical protein
MTSAATTAVAMPPARTLARRAFTGAAAALFVLFYGNNLPSALYGLLRGIFGFSTPAAERGAVLGATYFVNYAGLGVSVIGVGVLSLWTGLETAAIVIATGCAVLIPLVIRRA